VYLIIDYILHGVRVPTIIEVFAQIVVCLVFMACANVCYFIGPFSEYLVRPTDVARYRRVAFRLGLWLSCALPFLFMFAGFTIVVWQRNHE
jgi:riboflavin transporter FmnP